MTTWYRYRGFRIWKFDGYYDVHPSGSKSHQPIAEGFATAKEAREFIDRERIDLAFERGTFRITPLR